MYDYRSAIPAQAAQRLGMQGQRPPESIIAALKAQRSYLSATQGAQIAGCHLETFYRFIASGLPAEKLGRRWRIDPIQYAVWLETHWNEPVVSAQSANVPAQKKTS